MKIACAKKIVSNIPVLASGCFMRSVYHTHYSVSQELFIKNSWQGGAESALILEVSPKSFTS
jgi:hypothetical protein